MKAQVARRKWEDDSLWATRDRLPAAGKNGRRAVGYPLPATRCRQEWPRAGGASGSG